MLGICWFVLLDFAFDIVRLLLGWVCLKVCVLIVAWFLGLVFLLFWWLLINCVVCLCYLRVCCWIG